MQDRELYQQILGIEKPWRVVGVELDVEDGEVRVHVGYLESKPPCPECGRPCSRYDKRTRRWRHLDTCQYPTILDDEPLPALSIDDVTVEEGDAGVTEAASSSRRIRRSESRSG